MPNHLKWGTVESLWGLLAEGADSVTHCLQHTSVISICFSFTFTASDLDGYRLLC